MKHSAGGLKPARNATPPQSRSVPCLIGDAMSDALFLPRELFSPALPKPAMQPVAQPRRGAHFASGEAVAADLLKGMTPMSTLAAASTDRRRAPRPANARGVDLYIA
jgi:hypothetical protein